MGYSLSYIAYVLFGGPLNKHGMIGRGQASLLLPLLQGTFRIHGRFSNS